VPDIAMCHGDNCPRKIACYRHRAVPTATRQSYFATAPVRPDGSCGNFVELMTNDVLDVGDDPSDMVSLGMSIEVARGEESFDPSAIEGTAMLDDEDDQGRHG